MNRIQLYYQSTLIRDYTFSAEARKDEIIETWKKLYGKKFTKAEVKIIRGERKK